MKWINLNWIYLEVISNLCIILSVLIQLATLEYNPECQGNHEIVALLLARRLTRLP